jgi:hypothetical protein
MWQVVRRCQPRLEMPRQIPGSDSPVQAFSAIKVRRCAPLPTRFVDLAFGCLRMVGSSPAPAVRVFVLAKGKSRAAPLRRRNGAYSLNAHNLFILEPRCHKSSKIRTVECRYV